MGAAGGAVPPELARLTRGQALFLCVGGTDPVVWTRPGSAAGMLLTLPTGYSLVGWAGLDGAPIAEAVGRFGEALVGASRWNAETQSYERYEPGAEEPAEGMPVLQHGDALWVELSAERRWWQSGTERTTFVFEAPVTQERKSELRDEMERVVAFFAERYGIEPPHFIVLVDPTSHFSASAGTGRIQVGRRGVENPRREFVLTHEYVHVLQFRLGQQHPTASGSPAWLTEGAAKYAADGYGRLRRGERDDRIRTSWWRGSLDLTAPLSDLEDSQPFYALGRAGYDLGTLATDWLVRRAAVSSGGVSFSPLEPGGLDAGPGYGAHMQYYRLLPPSGSWQQAFEAAFGVSVNEFYAAFEAYRGEVAPPLPHLADDVDEPILVLVGEVSAEAAEPYRTKLRVLQTLFRERFGAELADYTLYIAADSELAAAAYLRALGRELQYFGCSQGEGGVLLIQVVGCSVSPDPVPRLHHDAVVRELAPWESLPPALSGYTGLGPSWLQTATQTYAGSAYLAVTGTETFEGIRSGFATLASQTELPLRNMETYGAAPRPPYWVGRALSFLAADWLAEQAGEPALFEYYRLLPTSDTWEEAFEGAFGLPIDDFYAAFEAYRAAGFTS